MGKAFEAVIPIQREQVHVKDDKGELHTLYICEISALQQEAIAAAISQRRGDMTPRQFTDEHPNLVNAIVLAQALQDEQGEKPPLDWVLSLPRSIFEAWRDKALAINSVEPERLEKN